MLAYKLLKIEHFKADDMYNTKGSKVGVELISKIAFN